MKLSEFDYNLPRKAIAKYPVEPRDACKLMVIDREKQIIDIKIFSDIVDYFHKGDVLVLNETKVIQARLYGKKERTNAKIEVFLLRELNAKENIWDVQVEPARKVRIGNKIYFDDKFYCEIIDNTTSRGRTIRFVCPGDIHEYIDKYGVTPLPPYIKREAEEADRTNYQTVYAKIKGSVAAPTAGLHFTEELLEKLKKKGVKIAPVLLHIGLGTFREVEVEDLSKHRMDSEYFEIPAASADIINSAIEHNKKIFVCGTSSVRALESSHTADDFVKPTKGWTDKFIYPPYDFKVVQHMITNFHMPKSTLIMMVAAFAGYELTMKAYKKALKEGFRFLSYGDAMLIL